MIIANENKLLKVSISGIVNSIQFIKTINW